MPSSTKLFWFGRWNCNCSIKTRCDHEPHNAAYNGNKRKHALKYQAVTTLDGLLLHVYGPLEGRRHDWPLYMRSVSDKSLDEILLADVKPYVLYSDSGYSSREFMEVPFEGSNLSPAQSAFNRAMSRVRVTVQWVFKEAKLHWTKFDYKRKMQVGESPIVALYVAAVLFLNLRDCVYPNTVAQYVNCTPLTLEKYLVHRN